MAVFVCGVYFKIKQMQLSEGTFLKEEHVFPKLYGNRGIANFNVVLGPILTSPTNEDETRPIRGVADRGLNLGACTTPHNFLQGLIRSC